MREAGTLLWSGRLGLMAGGPGDDGGGDECRGRFKTRRDH